MATTLEIINGISQVMANSHDGATDDKFEPLLVGLQREEGNPITDSRVIDGFSVRIHNGDRLCIYYTSETPLKEVHGSSFESDIESRLEKIKSFIQKEYKSITGKSLSLSDPDEVNVVVEYISRIRTQVRAKKSFKIGGIDATPVKGESEERLEDSFKKWLSQGKNDKLF